MTKLYYAHHGQNNQGAKLFPARGAAEHDCVVRSVRGEGFIVPSLNPSGGGGGHNQADERDVCRRRMEGLSVSGLSDVSPSPAYRVSN